MRKKTRILILAHGEQQRLVDLGHPKQMLHIADHETIIERTIRLFVEVTDDIIVVAPQTAPWLSLEEKHSNQFSIHCIPHPGGPILHGLEQTSPLWLGAEKLLILLGDVVYSRQAIRRLSTADELTFVGRSGKSSITGKRWGELFGLVLLEEDFESLTGALNSSYWTTTGGKLWDLFNYMRTQLRKPFAFIELVNDYTEDIDTVEDIQNVLPKLRDFVQLEEVEWNVED